MAEEIKKYLVVGAGVMVLPFHRYLRPMGIRP